MLTLGIFKWFEPVFDTLEYGIIGLWSTIDGIVYRLVSVFFKLFYALAEVQLLDNSIYRAIASRVYLFIGVIALFMLSSSLLKALVNPDEINKGVIKSFKSLITSVILVVLIPTIFKYAFSMQSAILSDNIIGKIFQIDLNEFKETGESKITNSSDSMYEVCNFETKPEKTVFVNDSSGKNISGASKITHNECQGNYITLTVLEAFFTPNNSDYSKITNSYGTSWAAARLYMVYTGNFNYMTTFAKNAYDEDRDNSISYSFIISTVSAAFLIYLLLSFSIDLGVRAAKLAFYQLIAPIPVLMKMIPGKEGQFDKWSKATISVFLEVFVRLIVIEFAIFMCSNLFAIIDSMNGFSSVGLIGKAVLALGLFSFAKQAPKLLGEALGFEAGNLKFGIKGKLTDTPIVGKAFGAAYDTANKFKGMATGALGGGWTGLMNGVGFKSGAAIGASKGFKSGGNQFNTQRQGVYKAFGGDGKAGLFGGRGFVDSKIDNVEKSGKNKFKEDFKNSQEYQFRYNKEIANQKANRQQAIDTAQNEYNNLNSKIKSMRDSINEFKNSDLYQAWSKEANNKINGLINLGKVNANDTNTINKIKSDYINDMLQAYKNSGQDTDGKVMQYMSNLDKFASAQKDLIDAKNNIDKAQNIKIDSDLATKAVNEFYRTSKDKDLSFAGKAYKKEMESDYFKRYREENAEQIDLYAEAMKKMSKDDAKKTSSGSSETDKK